MYLFALVFWEYFLVGILVTCFAGLVIWSIQRYIAGATKAEHIKVLADSPKAIECATALGLDVSAIKSHATMILMKSFPTKRNEDDQKVREFLGELSKRSDERQLPAPVSSMPKLDWIEGLLTVVHNQLLSARILSYKEATWLLLSTNKASHAALVITTSLLVLETQSVMNKYGFAIEPHNAEQMKEINNIKLDGLDALFAKFAREANLGDEPVAGITRMIERVRSPL